MRFNHETLSALSGHLIDPMTDAVAPKALAAALLQLAGVEPPRASMCRNHHNDGTNNNTWRAAWLTTTHLIYAEATRDTGGISWNMRSEDLDPDTLTAWARPLASVSAISTSELTARADASGLIEVSSRHQVTFDDGGRLDIPLAGDTPRRADREAAESFLAALVAAVSEASTQAPDSRPENPRSR